MDDGPTPARGRDRTSTRRVDRALAGGSVAATLAATLTLSVSLVAGVDAVATTAPLYYALVGPVAAAGVLVVGAMVARGALALGRWRRTSRRRLRDVSVLKAIAFVVELGVVAGGVLAVGWGFALVHTVASGGPGGTVAPGRVVYGVFGCFVLVVGCLPVSFRAARRARPD